MLVELCWNLCLASGTALQRKIHPSGTSLRVSGTWWNYVLLVEQGCTLVEQGCTLCPASGTGLHTSGHRVVEGGHAVDLVIHESGTRWASYRS